MAVAAEAPREGGGREAVQVRGAAARRGRLWGSYSRGAPLGNGVRGRAAPHRAAHTGSSEAGPY